ncbi:hypothetical protein FJY84_01030 [Candidatus Bathyarchaeota archaeon]|nr:hypothetical protein [Candidatus Bathyarchaeota archaeon]
MKKLISYLILLLMLGSVTNFNVSAVDNITSADFEKESWSKTIDLIEYARSHINETGGIQPPVNWSSQTVLNYINIYGVKLLYAGFSGLTIDKASFQIPLQSFVERFKTREGLEALSASSFLMMVAFNDTKNSIYPNSPDEGDNLWASFSMGTDFTEFFGNNIAPHFSGSVKVTPLTATQDKKGWSWGMSYYNMTAIWWKLVTKSGSPDYSKIPVNFCVYDEISFNYKLVFDTVNGEAKLFLTYNIGEIRNLWGFTWVGLFPTLYHYNDTGCFLWGKTKVSSETVHTFLKNNGIKMSIVLVQRNYVANQTLTSSSSGKPASQAGIDVSKGIIETKVSNGAKVYSIDFGSKISYKLYKTSTPSQYDSITRTELVEKYAKNPVVEIQTSLLKIMNLMVKRITPDQYWSNVSSFFDISKSDYLYITSYPTYEGYKVMHDPVYTAYIPPIENKSNFNEIIVPLTALGAIAIITIILLRKK